MTATPINAFVTDCEIASRHASDGPLSGMTFGVKDLLDVAGVPTGAGNPDWRRTHAVPERTAPSVARLLDAGARLVGKTITDELAWDLDGENAHHGTPVNVAAPGRIPGGSSSGSAAATAAGLCDFAIGTDTGGSVRLPASFCGLYGIRPTHGRIPSEGVVPLAPSFDTIGWFARDPQVLRAVSEVMLGAAGEVVPTERLVIADDLFALASPAIRAALSPAVERLAALVRRVEHVTVADGDAPVWRDAFRTIQAREAWTTHRDWIQRTDPSFGTDIREHIEEGEHLDADVVERAQAVRDEVRARMSRLVVPGTLLVLPTAPDIAPRLDASEAERADIRDRAHRMLCLAGHAGLPQLSMPLATSNDCPIGLSAIAAHGHDEALVSLATRLAEAR